MKMIYLEKPSFDDSFKKMFLVPAWLLNWFFFKTKVSRILPGKAECEYCWRQDETNRIWSLKYIEC